MTIEVPALQRIPPPEPTGHLVITVGGSPVPIVATLLGLRPANVLAVVSAQSADVWDRAWAAYGLLDSAAKGAQVLKCEVPAHDWAAVTGELAAAHLAVPWSLGYAGGSPTMSAGAFDVWWTTHQDESTAGAWYVAEAGDVLVRHDGCFVELADVLCGRRLTLADFVVMHGLTPAYIERRPERWRPHLSQDPPTQVHQALCNLDAEIEGTKLAVTNRTVAALVTEAVSLVASRGEADVYSDVRVLTDSEPAEWLDLDIVVIRGLSAAFIRPAAYTAESRKPRTPKRRLKWSTGALKEELFDLAEIAREVGGLHAAAAIISLERAVSGRSQQVAALWADLGPTVLPERLTTGADEPVAPLPAVTAFSLEELLDALGECESDEPVEVCGDFTRWVLGLTE